jgi:phospholipase A2
MIRFPKATEPCRTLALTLVACRSVHVSVARQDDDAAASKPWTSLDRFKQLMPSLPPLPGLPSINLKKLQDTWEQTYRNFGLIAGELSGGPGSLYSTLVNEHRLDAKSNPEIEWEASVRLGADLPLQEKAFLRLRRRRMRKAFAQMLDLPEDDVDVRDLPVVGLAGSGGGYRAMINTTGSLRAADRSGLLDLTSYVAAISGSCWAIGQLYSMADGHIPSLIQHMRSRIQDDFFDPVTLDLLTKPPTNSYLLAGPVVKQAGQAGDLSLVDAYGVLVSSRLFIPEDTQHLHLNRLKLSHQQAVFADGTFPMPIYNVIRHDVPPVEKLAELRDAKAAEARQIFEHRREEKAVEVDRKEQELVQESQWQWFELSPFEVGLLCPCRGFPGKQ